MELILSISLNGVLIVALVVCEIYHRRDARWYAKAAMEEARWHKRADMSENVAQLSYSEAIAQKRPIEQSDHDAFKEHIQVSDSRKEQLEEDEALSALEKERVLIDGGDGLV